MITIADDPPELLPGKLLHADRFADVRPVLQDGRLCWGVYQQGTLLGIFPTREAALEYELTLPVDDRWRKEI